MRVCIDGIDGAGKTTLIDSLVPLYPQHEFQDRGLPSKLTEGLFWEGDKPDLIIILTCSCTIAYNRIVAAKKDLSDPYHHPRSLEVNNNLFIMFAGFCNWKVINADQSARLVLNAAKMYIDKADRSPVERTTYTYYKMLQDSARL